MTATGTTPPIPSSDTVPALRVSDARKVFDDTVAVDGVSFDLAPSELLALVGPSGCGKSTLLRAIAGLTPLDTGSIELSGIIVDDGRAHVAPERRHIGLVFQEHALFPHLNVVDNVAFGVRKDPDRHARVAHVLDLVGMGRYSARYPHELSGGERQRVALARALAPRPTLMLLDEPFASLDPNLRAQVRADVVHVLRVEGTPAVFVTHDQSEALAVGDRVAVMRAGEILQLDTPEEIFHHPVSTFIGSFMGEASYLRMDDHDLDLSRLVDKPVPADAVAMLRPDDITFEMDDDGAAEIIDAEFRGSTWCYTIRLASGATVRSTRSHLLRAPIGARVRATVTPGHRPVLVHDGS